MNDNNITDSALLMKLEMMEKNIDHNFEEVKENVREIKSQLITLNGQVKRNTIGREKQKTYNAIATWAGALIITSMMGIIAFFVVRVL